MGSRSSQSFSSSSGGKSSNAIACGRISPSDQRAHRWSLLAIGLTKESSRNVILPMQVIQNLPISIKLVLLTLLGTQLIEGQHQSSPCTGTPTLPALVTSLRLRSLKPVIFFFTLSLPGREAATPPPPGPAALAVQHTPETVVQHILLRGECRLPVLLGGRQEQDTGNEMEKVNMGCLKILLSLHGQALQEGRVSNEDPAPALARWPCPRGAGLTRATPARPLSPCACAAAVACRPPRYPPPRCRQCPPLRQRAPPLPSSAWPLAPAPCEGTDRPILFFMSY